VTVNCGTWFVGVEVVGLGVLPLCGLGCCAPGGMNRDGALPVMGFEGLYGTDTGRTPGLTGGIPVMDCLPVALGLFMQFAIPSLKIRISIVISSLFWHLLI